MGIGTFEIRKKNDLLQPMDGIILPGGESTTIGKLLVDLDMQEDLITLINKGMPVFGTCAGMILLARKITDAEPHLGVMDITVRRNAYGRQLGSFHTVAPFKGVGKVPMTFIRAPYIEEAGEEVKILAEVNGHIVAAVQKKKLAVAFHPELLKDNRVHRYFIDRLVL